MRVLVVEDDPGLRSVLERGLREQGYIVDVVADGPDALSYLRSYTYEGAILDWRLPRLSGIDVVESMRRRGDRTPVLMLTARDTTEDRVEGLNRGADDYLVKPFSFAELTARVSALQRRPALVLDPVLRCGDLDFDPSTRQLSRAGTPIVLTATEIALIELLMRRAPGVVPRRMITVQVWDDEASAVGSNTIDVHIARLRAKLAGATARITTVRGVGYRLVPD